MNNVMLDLETMSTVSNAAIVAIGAVCFDINTATIGRTFYTNVKLQSCIDAGLHVDGGTVMWWLSQSEVARTALTGTHGLSLTTALEGFASWLPGDPILWGNGSDFDNVILLNAYRSCGIDVPWRFYNNRCYRTVKSMHPDIKLERRGTHHNALDDAVTQAEHLVRMWN